jgi:UDP-N-acetyl-D-mannosaminuronate dehydrogenase
MVNILQLKLEEIDTPEKRGTINGCVVGCNREGVNYALMFAEAGFKVMCVDADPVVVKNLKKGRTAFSERALESKLRGYLNSDNLKVTGDLKEAVAQSSIIIFTSSVKLTDETSDSSEIETACKQIGAAMQNGTLFFYVGLAGLNFVKDVVRETLESASGFKVGQSFGLAYVKNQAYPTEKVAAHGYGEFIVAAMDNSSLNAAALILSTITKQVIKQTAYLNVAELANLFALASLDVSKALMNDFALICEKAKVDYFEAVKLLNSRLVDSDYIPRLDEQNDDLGTRLLLESAENLGVKSRLINLARHVNDDLAKHAFNLVQDTLHNCGKTLRRSRIVVLGTTLQGTVGDVLVKMLQGKGARVNLYGSARSEHENVEVKAVPRRNLLETFENCDCAVFLTADESFKRLSLRNLHSVMRSCAIVVDLVGVFEPEKVESEGFIYCGFGRGFEKQ